MKLLKPAILLLLVFLIQSCDLIPLKPGIWKDDKVEAGKRTDLHALNDLLLKNIKAGDQSAIEGMLSGDFLEGNYKRPVEGFDRDMGIFYGNLINELNKRYTYPIAITGVPTQPKIFRIENQSVNIGTYPAVCYLSKINIKDTVALKKENEQVKKVIGNVIPGIDKDKDYMLYNIYNEKPNTSSNAYSYDVTVNLK